MRSSYKTAAEEEEHICIWTAITAISALERPKSPHRLFHCLLHHKQSKLILFHPCLLLQKKQSEDSTIVQLSLCPPPPVYIFIHPLLHIVALQEDRHWLILDLNYRNFLYNTNETSLLIEKYFTGRACRKSSEDAKEARKWQQHVQDIRTTAYKIGSTLFQSVKSNRNQL